MQNQKKLNSNENLFAEEAYKPTVTSTPASLKSSPKTESSVPAPPLAKPTATKAAPAVESPKAEIPKAVAVPLPRDVSELEKLAEQAASTAVKHYQSAVKVLKG